jgi:hypothetical protein
MSTDLLEDVRRGDPVATGELADFVEFALQR